MKKIWRFGKLWQRVIAVCVGVPAVAAALYGTWELVVKVDSRWEKSEAAAEQKKATQQQFQQIERILQKSTLADLKRERDAYLNEAKKRRLTGFEDGRLRELMDQIKEIEDSLKK